MSMTEVELLDIHERARVLRRDLYAQILADYKATLKSGLNPVLSDETTITIKPSCGGRYAVAVTAISCGTGYFGSTLVEILDATTGALLGHYVRGYGSFAERTFHPFHQNGKDYALYSRDYTATRVLSLPSCINLGGEGPDGYGFCPVEYWSPDPNPIDDPDPEDADDQPDGTWALVAGCVWGDDHSWKVQLVDLRDPTKPILVQRFGYAELDRKDQLVDAITCCDRNVITLRTTRHYDIWKEP